MADIVSRETKKKLKVLKINVHRPATWQRYINLIILASVAPGILNWMVPSLTRNRCTVITNVQFFDINKLSLSTARYKMYVVSEPQHCKNMRSFIFREAILIIYHVGFEISVSGFINLIK